MTQIAKVKKIKADAVRRSAQRVEMKMELAAHAVAALSELGYARTGMRDIAQVSGRSVGAFSYYFEDKVDLVCFCVREYKQRFIDEINQISETGLPSLDIQTAVIDGFVGAIEADAATHRLWYDIRSQALFDEGFREVVTEIEASLIDMIGKTLTALGKTNTSAVFGYYLLDGVFQSHLRAACESDHWDSKKMFADISNTLVLLD